MSRILTFLIMLTVVTPVWAADWTIARVRGEALVMSNGSWGKASAGAVLSSGDSLRTGANGRMSLSRGKETVELASNTEIKLFDEGPQRMTALMQKSGTVTADVERRNVQHFSVQTPFMAAVVKGTRFSVSVGSSGATVEVFRGQVQVQDHVHSQFVDITPGQQASVSPSTTLAVEGARNPVIYTMDAVPVAAAPSIEATGEDNATSTASENQGRGQDDANRGNGRENSTAGGNANGNGQSNGNSNSQGNNGNGNANGQSGNQGNGNSGNSGSGSNGNSNGNGNANSQGNNGNGNGNGNANGQSGNQGNGNGQGNNGNGRGNGNDT